MRYVSRLAVVASAVVIALVVAMPQPASAQDVKKSDAKKPAAKKLAVKKKADAKAADDDPNFVLPPREGKSETIKLFNGRDLTGWKGHEDLWSVKDGVIVAHNTKPIKVSTYLLTDRTFTDFRLLATVKLVESEMHSGIAMWGRNCAGARRQVHLRRPPGDVPLGLGLLRSVRPQRPAG